jgi:hypothetical protein
MSLPPPPDPYRPPQPGYGPGQSARGQWQPPQYASGAQQPGQGQPYGQPPWGPPPSAPPPDSPNRGSGLKWLLITVAVLLVVAISVGTTLLFTRGNGDSSPTATVPPTTGAAGEIASANDTGPVSVITEDPTCAPWRPVASTLGDVQRAGWDKRDASIPVAAWTPDLRGQYEAVERAMRSAADQTVALAKDTPHRVMRELYEQTIAYWRAYADSISNYASRDNQLALVANAGSAVLVNICAAITYDSAAARGPQVAQAPPPTQIAAIGDAADPQQFLTAPATSICSEWSSAMTQFLDDTAAWRATDKNIPASKWTEEQRALNDEVAPVMLTFADKIQNLGVRSNNATLEDFAILAAQYRRAFVHSLPTYTPQDNYLSLAAAQMVFAVDDACKAAGS